MTDPVPVTDTRAVVLDLLASASGVPAADLAALPGTTPLFGPPVGLASRTGAQLLDRILEVTGVDVAGEDLALESLTSVGALVAFVAERR